MISKLTDLKAAEYNPRRITEASLDGLKYSLKEFGDISGIVYNDKTGHLVAGHQRVSALLSEHGDLEIQNGEILCPNGERFAVRTVHWDLPKEKAANVAANSPTISGQFTPDLFPLLDEIKFEMPESFNGMNFEQLFSLPFNMVEGADYSDKNKELSADDFASDKIVMSFEFSYDENEAVKEALSSYDANREQALLKVLGINV